MVLLKRNRQSIWLLNRQALIELKSMCDNHTAIVEDLKVKLYFCFHISMNSFMIENN
jgi:hypothetical protein